MAREQFRLPDLEERSAGLVIRTAEAHIAISLKYWHSGSQCLSDWQRSELTKLRKLIDKVQGLTASQVRNDPGLQWKVHKGPAARGFARPAALSKDIDLCELRVDGKARVHGALFDGTFFLVWLDRAHAVFPDGK